MRAKILWSVVAIAIGVSVYIVSTLIEKYETQIWSGASRAARENPYLAAQQFLESRDVVVISSTDTLDFESIDTSDTVFLSRVDSMLVSQSQVDKAMAWISRGGYLLVGVSAEIEGRASILNEFDISPTERAIEIEDAFVDDDGEPLKASERMREINRQIEEELAKKPQAKTEAKADADRADAASGDATDTTEPKAKINANDDFTKQLFDLLNIDYEHEYYRVNLSDASDQAFLAVLDRITLEHELLYSGGDGFDDGDDVSSEEFDDEYYDELDESHVNSKSDTEVQANERTSANGDYKLTTWVNDEHGARLLQFEYGEGTFTALSSAQYWENGYIGLADHAYFLSYLVPNESRLHLFYNVTAPPLSALLKRYFFELLLAAFVLLALWLWRNGIRVQPVTQVNDGERRSFAEHLRASAKFLVANQQFQVLIEPLKEDIELQMRPFYSNFSQLNERMQVELLAERTQLPNDTLTAWVRYSKKVESQDELLAALKIGNAIRKTL